MIVLGLDPGFASLGWALVEITSQDERILHVGTIRTAKARTRVLVTDDLHRRGQELARALAALLESYPTVGAICAESWSQPRNASAAAKVARAWGVIDALAEARALPLLSASPQAIKKAMTGKASASKEEVIAALDALLDGGMEAALVAGKVNKGQREHAADAVGAVVACLDHPHLRLARMAHEGAQARGRGVVERDGGDVATVTVAKGASDE